MRSPASFPTLSLAMNFLTSLMALSVIVSSIRNHTPLSNLEDRLAWAAPTRAWQTSGTSQNDSPRTHFGLADPRLAETLSDEPPTADLYYIRRVPWLQDPRANTAPSLIECFLTKVGGYECP